MEPLDSLDPLGAAVAALLVVLAVLVAVINWQGKRLGKHAELLRLLDLRVGNIHKGRRATWARQLQKPRGPLVPPPLPPRAPTIDATDWDDERLATEPLTLKDTARYPLGEPPKGDGDE